jgi:hypothetical protein
VTPCLSDMPEYNVHSPYCENLEFHAQLVVRIACIFSIRLSHNTVIKGVNSYVIHLRINCLICERDCFCLDKTQKVYSPRNTWNAAQCGNFRSSTETLDYRIFCCLPVIAVSPVVCRVSLHRHWGNISHYFPHSHCL